MSVLATHLMSPLSLKIPKEMILVKLASVHILECLHKRTNIQMSQVLLLVLKYLRLLSWTGIAMTGHNSIAKISI